MVILPFEGSGISSTYCRTASAINGALFYKEAGEIISDAFDIWENSQSYVR